MYRGRFAPTPSGPLHLGSLLTALAGFMQARSRGGAWLLRIDDLDAPRCVPGAEAEILRQLRAHGLDWDGEPVRQSARGRQYRDAIARLDASGQTYRCACTREVLRGAQAAGPDGPVYPGTCRSAGHSTGSLRARLPAAPVALRERGATFVRRAEDIGDPVIERADGIPGYALASVVDESAMGITEIVRGADLLGASVQQQALRPLLGLAEPLHLHLPLLTDAQGRKLSKQNHAAPLDELAPASNLRRCLEWLGQEPEAGLDVAGTLRHALERWNAAAIPGTRAIVV